MSDSDRPPNNPGNSSSDGTEPDGRAGNLKLAGVNSPETRIVKRVKWHRSPSLCRSDVKPVKTEDRIEKEGYTSPTEIAKIFRNMITADELCQLSAMLDGTPSDVKWIIPKASVDQICKMCEL